MANRDNNKIAINNGLSPSPSPSPARENPCELKDAQGLLPHLESLERIIKLPMVGAAWDKSQDVHGKVKGQNRVFNWAFNAAEDCVVRAITIAAPLINRLHNPIQYVDQTLVKGINKLEVHAPIIKDTPQEIYQQTVIKVIDCVQPHIDRVVKLKSVSQEKASSLKDLAWHKANEILATQYGSLAVTGVDSTSALAERLLEYYFPNSDDEIEESFDENNETDDVNQLGKKSETDVPVAAANDPVLHTVQTVGRLSNKISRRVYHNVNQQLKKVQNGNATDYLSSLIAALKLHQYINFINASMGGNNSVELNGTVVNVSTKAADDVSCHSTSKISLPTQSPVSLPVYTNKAALLTTNKSTSTQ